MAEIQGQEERGTLSSDPTDATNLHGPNEQASRFLIYFCMLTCKMAKQKNLPHRYCESKSCLLISILRSLV